MSARPFHASWTIEPLAVTRFLYHAPHSSGPAAELRSFDVIRLARKTCSNIHVLGLMRAEGVLVDSV